MSGTRWDILDQIPDDLNISGSDYTEAPLTLDVWRDALGHPRAEGHGYCTTCGVGTTCLVLAFHDAMQVSTVRELDQRGLLPPRKETP